MNAAGIIICVAILMLAAAIWDDRRRSGAVHASTRTYLTVACIMAIVAAILNMLNTP